MPTASGRFTMRIVVLTVQRTTAPNNEEVPAWPDPPAGTNEYFAAREALTSGEQIAQGLARSTGGMTLRIRGNRIAVTTADRVRNKATGELFEVVGVSRPDDETLITLERVTGQETPQ